MLRQLFQHIEFEWPWALMMLVVVPWLAWKMFYKKKANIPRMKVSEFSPLTQGYNLKTSLRNLPTILRLFAFILIIIAIARPIHKENVELNSGKGIEIVLCLDVSGSMLAQDFEPNRLMASQRVANEFIKRRKGDKIGLVVFAGQSITLCPITTDHQALLYQLDNINYGILSDGTAIGTGLASAVERLRTGTSPSKIIVLLTDGEDTGGSMDPFTAKQIAKTFGVKVYTIGVGTEGYADIPFQTAMGTVLEKAKVSIDEKLLQEIASETGGNYYRAKNGAELENIYSAIDKLETSDIRTTYFNKKRDAFLPILIATLALLLMEWILTHTWLRKFP